MMSTPMYCAKCGNGAHQKSTRCSGRYEGHEKVTQCDAKIRPFPGDTELTCEETYPGHTQHYGVLRDYAFPGSVSMITWWENDRRNFRGKFAQCTRRGLLAPCVLPANHHGRCAV